MSSTDTRIALLKLRIEVNKANASDALKSIDKLKAGLREVDIAEREISPDAARAGAAIVKSNEAAKKSAIEAAKQTKELNNQIKQTGFLSEETRGKLSTIRQENRAESFATRTVANVLPGDIGNVSRELFDLVDTIPDLGTAFTVLKASIVDTLSVLGGGSALAGGGIVAALGLVAIAFKLISDESQRAYDATQQSILARQKLVELEATATTEQLNKERAAAVQLQETRRKQLEIAQEELNKLATAAENATDALPEGVSALDVFLNKIGVDAPGAIGAAQDAVTAAQKAFDDAATSVTNIDTALESAGVHANDAAAALAEFNKFMQEFTDRAAQARLQQNIEIDKLSSQAAHDKLDSIRNEIDLTEQSIETENLSADAVKALIDRLTVLRTQAQVIEGALAGIDARQQRTDTIAATKKYNEDIAKIEEQSRDAQTAAHEKYADSLVSIAEKAADAAENALRKLREKQQDLALDLSRDVADADVKRQQDQLDAQIKFADEEAKAAREHARDLKRIRLEGQRDETQAIQDRDAVALDAAQQNTRQRLQDANKDYDDQQQERRIAFGQELRDQQTQFAREAQARYQKYQRDLQDAQTQYNREIALAEQNRVQALTKAAQAYAQEQAQLAQKYTQERTQRQQAITAELALITTGYAQRLRIQTAYENALVAQSQRILGRLSAYSGYGSANAPTQDTGTVIPFASGGNAPGNRTLLVGERGPELVRFKQPSRIYSAGQTRQMGGGQVYQFNFEGATMETIDVRSKDQAVRFVAKTLQKMGAR